MKIVVVNPWHDDNKGDAAILQGTLQLAKDTLKEVEFCVLPCIDPVNPLYQGFLRHTSIEFPEIRIISHPLPPFPRRKRDWLYGISRALGNLLAPKVFGIESEKILDAADLVVIAGGLYLAFPHTNPLRPPLRLFAYLYPALYATRVRKPVVFWGHSLGPFLNAASRWLMGVSLKQACCIVTRESKSARVAQHLLPPYSQTRVFTAPDPAFYLRPQPSHEVDTYISSKLKTEKFVALVPRSLQGYGHTTEAEARLLDGLSVAAMKLSAQGYAIAVVAHTLGPSSKEDDRPMAEKLTERLRHEGIPAELFTDDLAPRKLMYFYGRASMVITVRFHGAVLSLAAGTPAIVIPYFGTKAEGTYGDLGLQDLVAPMDKDFPANLLRSIESAKQISRSDLKEKAETLREKLRLTFQSCLERCGYAHRRV